MREPKYKLGDKLYVIDTKWILDKADKKVAHLTLFVKELTVNEIGVSASLSVEKEDIDIWYSERKSEYMSVYGDEEDCFITRGEAEQEIKRREIDVREKDIEDLIEDN